MKKQRIIAIFLIIALLLPMFPPKAEAASDTWSYSSQDRPSGWGTANNPYVITTPEQLLRLLDNLSKGSYAVLGNDINLSAKIWPGSKVAGFAASLDGQGHTIWGMRSDCGALFDSLYEGGSISNLNIEATSAALNTGTLVNTCFGDVTNCTAFGTVYANLYDLKANSDQNRIGGLVGYQGSNLSGYVSTISGCKNYTNYYLWASGPYNAYLTAAGIAAYAEGNIVNCENYGTIQATVIPDTNNDPGLHLILSGIVGVMEEAGNTATNSNESSVISGCVNHAPISAIDVLTWSQYASRNTAAGIVGYIEYGSVSACENYGNIDASGCCAGGIVGNADYLGTDIQIRDCFNDADVTSQLHAGGIAGKLEASSGQTQVVESCSNTGDITGSEQVGGIVGSNEWRIVDCTNLGNVSGDGIQSNCGGIAGINIAAQRDANAAATEEPSGVVLRCTNKGTVDGKGYSGGICGTNEGFIYLSENIGSVSGFQVGGIAAANQPVPTGWASYGIIDSCTANCTLEAAGGDAAGISINGCNTVEAEMVIRDSYFRGNIFGSGANAYGVAGWGDNVPVNGCYAVFSASGFDNVYALYPTESAAGAPSSALCAGVYANQGGSKDYAVIRSGGKLRTCTGDLNTLGGTVASRGTWRDGSVYPEPAGLPMPIILPTVGSVDENGHTVYHATDGQRIIRVFAQGMKDPDQDHLPTAVVTHQDGSTSTYSSTWRVAYAEFRLNLDDTDTVTITAPGYQDNTVAAALLGFLTEIKLWPARSDNIPSLTGIYLDQSAGSYRKTYNLLTESYSVTRESLTEYSVYVDANWNGGEIGECYLMQGDYVRAILLEGWNHKLRLGQLLKWEEGDIHIALFNGTDWVNVPIRLQLREPIKKDQPLETGDRTTSPQGAPESAEGVAGQTFSVDFGVFSDLGVPLSIDVDPDDSIKATLGVTVGSMSQKTDAAGLTASKGKSAFTTIKNTLNNLSRDGKTMTEEEYDALEKKVTQNGEQVPKHKSHYGISVDAGFLGYAEGRVTDGRPYLSEVGGMFQIKGEFSGKQPVYIIVPFYVEYGIGASLRVFGALEQDPTTGKLVPKGYLVDPNSSGLRMDGELKFFGGPGIGDPDLISVILRAVGTITSEMSLPIDQNRMKLYSQIKGEIEGSIVGYKSTWTVWSGNPFIIYQDGEWFPDYSTFALAADPVCLLAEPLRDYLQTDSEFLANASPIATYANTSPSADVFLTNIYPYADVQQAAFSDGSRLLVWNGDLTSRPDADRSALYYSYYDASTNLWSDPALVESDDSTADYYHTLRCIDDTAYLLWNDADAPLTGAAGESVTEQDVIDRLNCLGLSYARFDQSSSCFIDLSSVTGENTAADILGDITTVGGVPTAVWVQTSNGLSPEDGKLWCASLTDGQWSPSALTDLTGTDGLAAAEENGDLVVYYGRGSSEDPSTIDLYRWCNGVETIVSGITDVTENKPAVSNGRLAWYQGGSISTADGLSAPITGGGDRFQYLYDPDTDRQAVIYSTVTESGGTLKAIFADNGIWGEPVTVAETDSGIFYSFSGALLDDGTLSVSANQWNDQEQTADLILAEIAPYPALALEHVDYEALTLVPGEDLHVTLSVTNTGARTAHAVRAEFYDGNSLVDSHIIPVAIPSGASETFIVNCMLPEDAIPECLAIQVSAVGTQASQQSSLLSFSADDSGTLSLKTADLSLEEMYAKQLNGQTLVTVQAVNRGTQTLDSAVLSLRAGSSDGQVLAVQTTSELAAHSSETILFVLDEALDAETVLYMTADEQANGENLISNNSILAVVQEKDAEGFSFDLAFSGEQLHLRAKNLTDTDMSVRFIAASYQDGRLLDCEIYDAELAAYTELWQKSPDLDLGDTVCVYALDADMNPIAAPVRIPVS